MCENDIDNGMWKCPWVCQEQNHMPHDIHDMAQMILGASIQAEHKTLANGTSAGKGWIMKEQMEHQMQQQGYAGYY